MGRFKFLKNKLGKEEKTKNESQKSATPDAAEQHATPPASDLSSETASKVTPARSFGFVKARQNSDGTQTDKAGNGQEVRPAPAESVSNSSNPQVPLTGEADEPKKPTILPGSDGEHRLQEKFGTTERAHTFYERQVLDFLSPAMQEFIGEQEFLFVASADRNGECDCTSKFGKPGFIRVLSSKYLMYPEFRGNGVYANLGNISENPHIAMLIIDFFKDTVGIHVNGRARLVENDELRNFADDLPENVVEEINKEGKKCPERWVMVEVEEAYIQCSKHIPLLRKEDKLIDWGTDSVAAKRGDYFQLQGLPLYDRVGGDKAMEVAVDLFYRKVLQDDLVARFFEDVDMEGQRLKQKSFLSMAFGGPYQYTGLDLRKTHKRLVDDMGLSDEHFKRVASIFRECLGELEITDKECDAMMEVIESNRDDILNR